MKTLRAPVLLAAFVFLLIADTGNAQRHSSTAVRGRSRDLQLENVEQLKGAFQNDAGKIRVVALLSPT